MQCNRLCLSSVQETVVVLVQVKLEQILAQGSPVLPLVSQV